MGCLYLHLNVLGRIDETQNWVNGMCLQESSDEQILNCWGNVLDLLKNDYERQESYHRTQASVHREECEQLTEKLRALEEEAKQKDEERRKEAEDWAKRQKERLKNRRFIGLDGIFVVVVKKSGVFDPITRVGGGRSIGVVYAAAYGRVKTVKDSRATLFASVNTEEIKGILGGLGGLGIDVINLFMWIVQSIYDVQHPEGGPPKPKHDLCVPGVDFCLGEKLNDVFVELLNLLGLEAPDVRQKRPTLVRVDAGLTEDIPQLAYLRGQAKELAKKGVEYYNTVVGYIGEINKFLREWGELYPGLPNLPNKLQQLEPIDLGEINWTGDLF